MATRVAVYKYPDSKRSELIGNVMFEGIQSCGDKVTISHARSFERADADVAVFYGYMKNIMEAYRAAGKPFVYVDLGYWGRHEGGRRAGYHKVSVNSRHPTGYFQRKPRPGDRFAHFSLDIKPYRPDDDGVVVVAGMSHKAARAEGFVAEQWERHIIGEIRKYTQRRILYRPKPNWRDARPIVGSDFVNDYYKKDLMPDLKRCYAMVSHHSNTNVDALLEGIPSFCWGGVAQPLSLSDVSKIEQPLRAEREQWAHDIAYTQWNVEEMRAGTVWRYLKDEGLV